MNFNFFLALILIIFLEACSTTSIPVLRHETGETLGSNAKSISIRAETSRAIPTPPTQSGDTFSSTQSSNQLSSALLGLNIKYGLLEKLDLKLDTPLLLGGGGWRFNAKYQLFGTPASSSAPGNFAVSAMMSYGKFASRGDVTYSTGSSTSTTSSPTSDATFTQSLSANTIEFSFPVSIKVLEGFIIYSGVYYSILKASGTIDLEDVEVSTSDLGFNLGIQNKIDSVLLNIEGMMLKAENPFSGDSNFEVYFGLSAGLSF